MSVPRRDLTRQVMCGSVAIGGGAPVTVQSMTTTKTEDAPATLAQIDRLAEAGCEIVRCAIPSADALDGFGKICAASPLPVVADIHFDHRLAIAAAERGAAALRINPGNIGSWDRVDAVIDAAKASGAAIRIGVRLEGETARAAISGQGEVFFRYTGKELMENGVRLPEIAVEGKNMSDTATDETMIGDNGGESQ